jgi:hypothetical protein
MTFASATADTPVCSVFAFIAAAIAMALAALLVALAVEMAYEAVSSDALEGPIPIPLITNVLPASTLGDDADD